MGKALYKNYGVAQDGFQISSVQFALHYFFENKISMHEFIRNVAECTKFSGYFIGTCYDGETVFNLLSQKNEGDSMTIMEDGHKIYEITKRYAQTGFPDDENSLGYAIDIYQESINRVFREYLVNYKLLVRIMENYGLVPVELETARKMGMPNNTGLFNELYESMKNEIHRNRHAEDDYGLAPNMSYSEKRISFMNRYFIFQKVRNVNTEKINKYMETGINADDETDLIEPELNLNEQNLQFKKLKVPKITINEYNPVGPSESEIPDEIDRQQKQANTDSSIIEQSKGNVVKIIRKTKKILPK